MASASSLLSEEQFLCSICLDVFTDPITTPCGHNYCKTCITHYWDSSVVCQCPLCKENFNDRPKLCVNKVLSEMADQFRNSKLKQSSITNIEPAEPEEVSCDFCTEPKLRAVKSCLACLASYCETHLEPHQRVTAFKRHKLIDPVKNLEDILCKKHDRPLELFCKTDHTCVCQFCTEADHKLHQIVSLKEAYDGKKAELGKTEAEVQQMIQERQVKIHEVKRSVELSNKAADREIADSVKVFTALISCIERSQAELMNVIEEKKKTTDKQAEDFIKELQQEITQLGKRSSELKQLSHTEDHLQLLQNVTSINTPVPSKDWTKVSVHPSSYVGTVRTAVDQLKKTLSEEMKKQSHITTLISSCGVNSSCREMTVSGPSKSVDEVRQSLQISQSSFSDAASQQDRHRTTQEIGMVKKDPSVSGGLTMDKCHWTVITTTFKKALADIKTKYNVSLEPKALAQDKVTVRVKPASSSAVASNNSLESHAFRALLRLYQKVVTSNLQLPYQEAQRA